MKKVFIKTYGCQMNVYDSERMSDALGADGYQETDRPDDADMVILNTCHIREKAAEKVYSELGRLRRIKDHRRQAGNDTVIAVAGCVAQAEGTEMVRRAPVIDLVVGPQAYHRLPDMARRSRENGTSLVDTEFPAEDKFAKLPAANPGTIAARGATAFLTVQEGCDKFCSFCVVPYTRGAEFSRPVDRIEAEARDMVSAGVREITLLGQNVNAYHGAGPNGRDWSLGRLLFRLARIDGLARLRYTTSHPNDVDDELIAAHRDLDVVMPHLHLPVQSGSDRILNAMNRRHTARDYIDVIERIRHSRPDLALSGDFIVGFPGESEADFTATVELVRQVTYAQAYSFKYSPRPGTPAADRTDQVSAADKADRLARLQALIGEQQVAFNRSMVGQVLPVLLDRTGRHDGQLVGRSPYLQAIHVDAPAALLGSVTPILVEAAGNNSLSGRLLTDDEPAHPAGVVAS